MCACACARVCLEGVGRGKEERMFIQRLVKVENANKR